MDPRHLKLYNEELHFIREMGKVFAANNPGVAARLDLGAAECTDPYVERLLEGFAFLTSRIQLQYQEEFPEFSQHLLDIIYPDFLSPLPSISIIQFHPDTTGKLKEAGFPVKRGAKLLSPRVSPKKVQCEFRTAHDIHLWPIEINHTQYLFPEDTHSNIKSAVHPDIFSDTRGVIRLSIKTTGDDIQFSDLDGLDKLPIYLSGSGHQSGSIYETLLAHTHQIVLHNEDSHSTQLINKNDLTPIGFEEETALLPTTRQGFQGFRLLQEYFAQPKRFMFVSLNNLKTSLQHFSETSLDIYFLLNKRDDNLLKTLTKDNFQLNCTPAINLFEKVADRVHLTKQPKKTTRRRSNKEVSHYLPGHPIIVDKSHPHNFEIYRILSVKGVGTYQGDDRLYYPFYSLNHSTLSKKEQSFYTLKRTPKIRTAKESSKYYQGNEIYISLSDNENKLPYSNKVKELRIKTLSTNSGTALYLGSTRVEFTTPNDSFPVDLKKGITNIEEFSTPRPPHLAGEHTWRLINLLSLNHLSIADENDSNASIKALRELLELQIHTQRVGDSTQSVLVYETQINRGLQKIETEKIVHPIHIQGKITYARGLQITITLEEEAFEGGSSFLFGSVLERFFAQYTSINSFTQTVIKTLERGEVMRWPIRAGNQKTL